MSVSHRVRTAAAIVALGSAVAPAAFGADAPDPGAVAAGEYLVYAGGCGSCHTAPGGKPFAGGRDLETPFGKLRTPNITPDSKTGIGGWTRDNFEGALRRGVLKEGGPIYPAMPYTHYTKINDADIDALWAYMQTLEPVSNEVVTNALPFPFNVRDSLIGWKALFFDEGRFEPDPNASDEVNRGAYLVEALAHCAVCHTPHTQLGAEETDRYLEGGAVDPWYAPDISNSGASALRDYDVDTLAAYLGGGNDGNSRRPVGPMAEVVFDNLSKLESADIHAIAVYLKNLAPPQPEPGAAPIELTQEARALGADLYVSNCASCHGDAGQGVAGVAARLAGSASIADGPPDNAIAVLLQGIEARGKWGAMPSFGEKFSDAQIVAVTNYIRASWGNQATVSADVDAVAHARPLVDAPARSMAASALCPNVPADRMDTATRDALTALGPTPSAAELKPVVTAYAEARSDLAPSVQHLMLIAVHCAGVVASGADPKAVVQDQVQFVDTLGALQQP